MTSFQQWLEQQVADKKQKVAEAENWRKSAEQAYKENKAFFDSEADRGEYNSACEEYREQLIRQRTLEGVLAKFVEEKNK